MLDVSPLVGKALSAGSNEEVRREYCHGHETPAHVIANHPDGKRNPEGAKYQERQQADRQGDAEIP